MCAGGAFVTSIGSGLGGLGAALRANRLGGLQPSGWVSWGSSGWVGWVQLSGGLGWVHLSCWVGWVQPWFSGCRGGGGI